MSLVGPRPERPEFVPSLERAIPHYRERLLVRPGVTGVAQDATAARHRPWPASAANSLYDLPYYIRHAGLWLDLRLVLCTAIHILGAAVSASSGRFFSSYQS